MYICMICNVVDLMNSKLKEEAEEQLATVVDHCVGDIDMPKEQVTVEERAIIVDGVVEDIAVPEVEEGENVVIDPSEPAEETAIIVSQLIEIMNICIIYNCEVVLNSNLKEQITVEERAMIVDHCVEDIAMLAVAEGETVVVETPKPAEDLAIIVS